MINLYQALINYAKRGAVKPVVIANFLQSGPTVPYNTGLASVNSGTFNPKVPGSHILLAAQTGALKTTDLGYLLKVN